MCNQNTHFFSLDELQVIAKSADLDAKFLAVDFNQWDPHVAASLSILEYLAQCGFTSFYHQAKFGFFPQFGKPYFGKDDFVKPNWLMQHKIRLATLVSKIPVRDLIDSELSEFMLESIAKVTDRKGLAQLKKDKFEYGYSLVSTLASTYGRSELNARLIRRFVPSLLEDYIKTVNQVYKIIIANRITHLIVFNGRFVRESAAISAAKAAGIKIVYHEASKSGSFFVSCFSPLSTEGYLELSQFLTKRINSDLISKSAEAWFKKRMQGDDFESAQFQKNWLPLSEFQEKNRCAVQHITIFTTSDDEFLGLSPAWDLPEAQSQIEWLTKIAKLAISLDFKVAIRLHPNLTSKSRSLRKSWAKLGKLDGLKLIAHDAKVNSYNLINQSDLVITCGSTIAMEAGFIGKPVLSVGTGIYDELQAVTKSQDLKDIEGKLMEAEFKSMKPMKSKVEIYGFTEMHKYENIRGGCIAPEFYLNLDLRKPSIFNKIVSKIYRELAFKSYFYWK